MSPDENRNLPGVCRRQEPPVGGRPLPLYAGAPAGALLPEKRSDYSCGNWSVSPSAWSTWICCTTSFSTCRMLNVAEPTLI